MKQHFPGTHCISLNCVESAEVTELELGDSLISCCCVSYFKYLDIKTLLKVMKTLPGTGENVRFIHENHLYLGLIS